MFFGIYGLYNLQQITPKMSAVLHISYPDNPVAFHTTLLAFYGAAPHIPKVYWKNQVLMPGTLYFNYDDVDYMSYIEHYIYEATVDALY
jgi:hypothetical protein